MPTFWQRNRRRAVALAAAGAAGAAAAYYVYKYYWTEEEAGGEPERLDADAARASTSGGGGGGVLVDLRDGGAAAAAALDAQAHLQHHFDSIQEIADATTIPSLLPALARALAAADDVDGALAALRAARAGGAPLSQDQKVALWREMAAAALARLAAACWALPLLDLQVRVALSVLGRQLYLEAALAEAPGGGGGGGGGAPLPPRPLSAPSQEAFLAHSEHLAKGGLSALVAAAQPGAAAALAGVPLGAALGAAELGAALSGALEALSGGAAAGGGGGWARFLLPPPPALREALRARRPDNRALLPAGEALVVDAEAVEALLAEKGRVLSSARFQEVATECAKGAARLAAARLAARLGGGTLPLPRLVPALVAEAGEVLAAGGQYSAQMAASPAVRLLCAHVYSCGPPP